jgi:nucleoid-associated protein YgaU
VTYGDRMDNLAAQFYNDPTQWWRIADANPEIFFPGQMAPGSIIRIPQA